MDVLNNKEISRLTPCIEGFSGEFIIDTENSRKWTAKGKYEIINTTTVKITELAPSVIYSKYEEYLDGLVEKKVISSYEDKSSGDIHYVIKFTKESLAKLIEKNILVNTLKIEENITENINTLDENGELMYFDDETQVIKYFVNFRLGYYKKRKDITLSDLLTNLKVFNAKYKFIRAVVDNVLEIKNVKRQELIDYFKSENYFSEDGSYDFLLRMPIHSLTEETIERLKKEIKEAKVEYDYIKEKEPIDMYKDDLNELLANI
jgi:DNA topoisomerase-2